MTCREKKKIRYGNVLRSCQSAANLLSDFKGPHMKYA